MHADERRERLERNAAAQAARARPTAAVADERKRPRSPDEHRGAAALPARHAVPTQQQRTQPQAATELPKFFTKRSATPGLPGNGPESTSATSIKEATRLLSAAEASRPPTKASIIDLTAI